MVFLIESLTNRWNAEDRRTSV